MSPLCPRLRRSIHLQEKAKSPMLSGIPNIPARKLFPIPPLTPVNPPPQKSKKKAAVPIQQPKTSSETSTASTNKNQIICFHHTTSLNPPSQEPNASSKYPADHTVLFYDKSSVESSSITTNARATGCHKKDIYPVITKELFEKDATYSSTYVSQPDKLEVKYWAQCNQFKSTGASVKPGDPAYQNLKSFITENILQAFSHFEDYDTLWHGIPSYDTRPFDSAPSTDRTSDFLAMICCGAATIPSQHPTAQGICNHQDTPEVQDPMNEDICANTNMLDDGGEPADAEGHQPISWDIDPGTGDILYHNCDMMMEDGEEGLVNKLNFQAEQEKGGREYEPEGAWTQIPVDADPPPGDLHRGGASFSGEYHFPNTVGPKLSPFGYLELHPGTHAAHSDQLHILWKTSAPHPFLAQALPHHPCHCLAVQLFCHDTLHQHPGYLKVTKGKTQSTLDQMKNNLREHLDNFDAGSQDQKLSSGILRNERDSMKMQAWMWDKEIMFLEAQQKTNFKLWKANAEVLEKQSQILMLQIHLAEFKKQSNHGHGADPSSSGADAGSGSGYA
ncbi:hypothetical protein BDN67DRAFT_1014945 [Paxillus ammoniavirescens]|nr:hypothetical protein BDN67DRAFT_1014945 [Paxillus ammoniavirescens]